MANQTRQQVAEQLNKLNSQGASEQQIINYVNSAGYKPDDFNVDLNGSFRPMVVGTGTVTQNYSAAELKESNNYYENLAASSSTVTPKPTASITTGSSTSRTVTTTEITNFQQTTGGGSTTVYSTPATDTSASLAYKAEASQAASLAESYRLNPDSKFGKSALDKRLADGRLSQEQYNEIVNSTPEQRREQSLAYSAQYEQARTNEISSQTAGQPVVQVTPAQNTSEISVEYQKTVTREDTVLTGEVAGTNVTTTTIDDVTYQVTTNENGEDVYTSSDGFSVADDSYETLSEPPDVTGDEFDGIDEQIANNENALQEPPELSDEEVNNYFDELQNEQVENYDPVDIDVDGGENVFDPGQTFNAGDENVFDPSGGSNYMGTGKVSITQAQATEQDVSNFYQTGDWRVRLSLAPGANYLYKASDPGILLPLNATNGVIFPYTPAISVVYAAQYDPFDLTHSNYKSYNYKSSSVDQISITCEFTAQDTFEANYLLAVIHFFRSVTKMFYGQDEKPDLGTPPPLCYLSGLGAFQFDKHPLAITSFNYSLPTDVDYIRATHTTTSAGVNKSASNSGITPTIAQIRGAPTGGNPGSPKWQTNTGGSVTPTYVPTKMQIQLSAVPIVSRNDISRAFSLRKYATGELLRGSKRNGGGIW